MINDYQHKRIPSTTNPTTPQRGTRQVTYAEAVEYHLRRAGASTRLADQLVTYNMQFLKTAAIDRRPAADIANTIYTAHTQRINRK
jgi:hypothetical protein